MVDGLAASALHLDRVIAMLGDLAQIQIGHVHLDPQPLDLGQVTQQVVAELEPALSQHPLDVSLPAEPVLLLGDEVQIARVIHNLLENAMKYSPQGGPIWLQLEQGTDQVVLTITDQGIGIPEADQPQVFNRFYRASNTHAANTSGLGIGLYLVNEVVTRHGGTVEVCSTAGEGSTFTIRFPLTGTAATLPDQQARGDDEQTGPAHADGAEHTPKAAP
jgi:signal transduction histidine kinase